MPIALLPAMAALAASLYVSPAAPELVARPGLVARLRETPHNYFRFVSRPFAEAVCSSFDDVLGTLPQASLHGDAHVEQYAVTSLGRGLTDFDDSARGPFVVDLVRFGVSLVLVSRENGWRDAGGAVDALLHGYRDALFDPSRERPPQRTLRRARAAFTFDHGLLLRRAEELMSSERINPAKLESDFQGYVAEMQARSPALPAGFFRIKMAGRLALGIGSALDDKYLLRVEGPTAGDEDDEILEAKLVRALPASGCMHTDIGPRRVLLGMSLIARAPFPYGGLLARGGRVFHVRGWTDDYVELRGESSFTVPRDLDEIAYDVGLQLGKAHPKVAPGRAPARAARIRLLESTYANEHRIRRAIAELSELTLKAWRAFRGEAQPGDTDACTARGEDASSRATEERGRHE